MARTSKRLSYLTDPAASSWQVVALSYPLFVLDSFGLFGTSAPIADQDVWQTLVASFLSQLVILGFVSLFHFTVLRLKFARRHPSLTLLSFSAAVIAGQLVHWIQRDASTNQNISFSLEALVYQTAVLSVVASVVVPLSQLRARLGELEKVNLELDLSQKQSMALLTQIREQAKDHVITSVKNAMVENSSKLDDLARSLRARAVKEIRKLSHQLAFNPKNLELVPISKRLPSWRETWSILGVKPKLAPNLMAWVMVLMAFRLTIEPPGEEQLTSSGVNLTLDLTGFLFSIAQLLVAWVSTYLAARFGEKAILRLRRGAREISFWKHLLVVLVVGLIASLATAGIGALASYEEGLGLSYLTLLFFSLPITFISIVVGFISAAKKRLRLAVGELDSKSQELRRNVAQINLAIFNEQQALSRFLHGKVQSTLNVIADRLELQNPTDLQLVQFHVQERVKDALQEFEKHFQPLPIRQGIRQVMELWSGVLAIEIDMLEYVAEIIDQDASCGAGLVEILSEACSNAHKHGRASELKIAISNPVPETIRLTIINNGSMVLLARSGQSQGYGSKIFDQFAESWYWSESHPATFVADLPLRVPTAS